ncbi:MAG: hypothetical protein ABR591_12355 [Candidatus Velthaea sp.]
MRSRKPALSLTLVAGAVLLLGAIAIGQRLGDRVLSQVTQRRTPIVGPIATPVPETSDAGFKRNWKREQVVSVATDPAFPDPRITPRPTPRPTPPPATPPPRPVRTEPPPASVYSSPRSAGPGTWTGSRTSPTSSST